MANYRSGIFILLFFTAANSAFSQTWPVPNQWKSKPFVGDFNGDGLDDVASYKGGNVYMNFSTGSGFTNTTWGSAISAWSNYTWAGDFNGDGLTDFANRVSHKKAGQIHVRLNTGSGFTAHTWNVASTWGGGAYSRSGDFNGDGIDDIASTKNGNVYMKLGTGNGFTSHTWPVANKWCGDKTLLVGDYNGDGKDDLASVCGTTVHMKISTGSGFESKTWTSDYGGWSNYLWAADFNGDGLTDLATRQSKAKGNIIKVLLNSGKSFDFLQGPVRTGEPWNPDWAVENLWGSGKYSVAGNFDENGRADVASFKKKNGYMKLNYSPIGLTGSTGSVPKFTSIFPSYTSSSSFTLIWETQHADSCQLVVDYIYNSFFYGPYKYNLKSSGQFKISNQGGYDTALWKMTCRGPGGSVKKTGNYHYNSY